MRLTCLFPSFLGLQGAPLDPSPDFQPMLSVWKWSMKNMLGRWKGLVLLKLKYLLGDFCKIRFGLIQNISFDPKENNLGFTIWIIYLLFVCLFNLQIQVTLFHEKCYFETKGCIETKGWKVFLDAVWLCNTRETPKWSVSFGCGEEKRMGMLHWGEAAATSQVWAPIFGLAVPTGREKDSTYSKFLSLF